MRRRLSLLWDCLKVSPPRGFVESCATPPNHGLRLSQLGNDQLLQVIEVWRDQTFELMTEQGFEQVFIFENNGEVVGVSNPHPHCQIFATLASV